MDAEITQAVERIKADIIAKYKSMNLQASGNFERGLTVEDYGNGVRLTAPHYVYQMEQGRSAGKAPPLAAIKRWIADKNKNAGTDIPEEAAYAIMLKIKQEGISVPNKFNAGGVVSSILTPELLSRLTEEINQIVKVRILNILNKK